MRLPWIALLLMGLVLWLHAPLWETKDLLGAAKTDVLRAVWGFDHQARGLPLPFWTDRVGFPGGVKLIILPLVSSILGAPLHALFGAVQGYDLWVLLLVWATGVTTAAWVRECSGSGAAGLFAGTAMIAQPSTFLSLTDGTPEYVAFWSVPLLLLLLHRARTDERPALPIVAGIVATVIALDSPYHAVFTLPLAIIPLSRVPWRRAAAFVGVSVLGAGLVALAYYGLPLAGPLENRAQNAVKLVVWWQWEAGRTREGWDHTYTPAWFPAKVMLVGTVLAFARLRAIPWMVVALLCLVLSLGAAEDNTQALSVWMGPAGKALGTSIAWFNETFGPPVVRFPRRWLVPFALALMTAAGIGLARLPREWMRLAVALPLSIFAVHDVLRSTGYRDELPHLSPPDPAFAAWIRESEDQGAALVAPRVRGASRLHQRDELPVFADLGSELSSADTWWIQVRIERPVVNAPNGLFTLVNRHADDPDVATLLRDIDDLCAPQTTGSAIAPSATMEPDRRAARARALVERGLHWIVADDAVFGEEGLNLLRLPFEGLILEERHFDDGTGVTVLHLSGTAP